MVKSVTPQPTPNPNALKFTIAGHTFDAPVTFANAGAASGTSFAEAIFEIPGVVSIFCTADFVTVTKDSSADWDAILPSAQQALERSF